MKKVITLLVSLAALALLLWSAGKLYERLGQKVDAEHPLTEETAPAGTPAAEEAPDPTATAEPERIVAPDFTAYDAEGNEVRLSDYAGKPTVLNFWASWCSPCRMEMGEFQTKYEECGESVQFLMVNMTDGSRETVESASAFIAGQGYTFPVLYDEDSAAAAAYGAYSLPTTYFLDADGYAVARAVGAIDAATLQQGLDMIWE